MQSLSPTHYYLGFNLVPGIGPARLTQLINRCGSVEAAWYADDQDIIAAGIDSKTRTALREAQHSLDLEAEFERTIAAGVQLVTVEDATYPSLLAQIPAPPPLLYVRGAIIRDDEWSVAVIGTRDPSLYGKEATRRIVTDLSRSSVTVVSGFALGIDAVAHSAALEAGGRTIAVLGCGVDVPYPERNQRLVPQILEQGALVSEYPLQTPPAPANFPPRNRIISGLALGTLVVEAGQKSGALITVDFALEQGRDVFAVPGSILSRKSVGTNRLIRTGAGLVTCGQDILDVLNLTGAGIQQEIVAALPEDPTEAALLTLISAEPQHADQLSRTCNMPAAIVAATLAMLELKGYIRQVAPMEYVLAREERARYSPETNANP